MTEAKELKCEKCLLKLETDIIQLDLDENSYTEDTFAICPKCGKYYQIGYRIVDITPKTGYDYYGEYYNNDF